MSKPASDAKTKVAQKQTLPLSTCQPENEAKTKRQTLTCQKLAGNGARLGDGRKFYNVQPGTAAD